MPQVDEQPLGKDVVAGIFLSLTSNFGSPTDAAELIVFLASDRARWITGAHVALDGGRALSSAR